MEIASYGRYVAKSLARSTNVPPAAVSHALSKLQVS